MKEPITFLDALVDALQCASEYNRNDQVQPAAVLWTDEQHQWEALIPFLRESLPLLTLGPYLPEQRTGPTYWIRCMIARKLPEDVVPVELTPIIYLPGVSKQEIRAVEDCPPALQPLAELQYRGVLWTQKNGRDWTIAAFLQSGDGGLAIEVGKDQATRDALKRALLKLADEPIVRLQQEAPLRAPFFDALLNPDDVRSLLLWLNDPAGYAKRIAPEEWAAFCQQCQQKYGFRPEKDGPISAAQLLAGQQANWRLVWERFVETPHFYPELPALLRKSRPVQLPLFGQPEVWPQDNESEERQLRQRLLELNQLSLQDARAAIYELEERHASRREWVWARINQSPLAMALESLTVLAQKAERSIGGGTLEEMTTAYADWGWNADDAVLKSLAAVEQGEDVEAVKVAIRSVYLPWLENTARAFQNAIASVDSGKGLPSAPFPETGEGTCILFSDALRFDVGQRLAAALMGRGYRCLIEKRLAVFPPVTATAKPAVSPITGLLVGKSAPELTPLVAETGIELNQAAFRRLLTDVGYQVLKQDELGDPSGRAWTELGAVDTYGHQHGWKIAHHVRGELRVLEKRVEALLEHGWTHILVVTDHGWLMLPGGLPKVHLPKHLTELRKGRCARLKEYSETDQQTVPWYWDQSVRIAVATGICCYEAGKEYEHGGLSPQECVVPTITVSGEAKPVAVVSIEVVAWKGLRCGVQITGPAPNLVVDIRTRAADPTTSLITAPKAPDREGNVSLLVEDEDRIGEAVFVVALDPDGQVCAQKHATVGG